MDLVQFHKLREGIQLSAPPGSGPELDNLEVNLRILLTASGVFDRVEVGQSVDPDRLVIALCDYKAEHTERYVAMLIQDLWNNWLRYPFWEAHHLIVQPRHVELVAASRESADGHYATLNIVAKEEPRIPEQRPPSE